jgi:hypothetical protein
LNGTHQLLVFADAVNLSTGNVDTARKSKEIVIDACKEVDLALNVEKAKYILLSRLQNSKGIDKKKSL